MLFSDLMVKILMTILMSGQIRNCFLTTLFFGGKIIYSSMIYYCIVTVRKKSITKFILQFFILELEFHYCFFDVLLLMLLWYVTVMIS